MMSDTNSNAAGTSGQSGSSQDLRQRALSAYETARDSAGDVGRKASDTLDEAPLIALAAGAAAGALIAALLPVSRRERELAKPVGDRVANAARSAAETARKVGSDKLRELGLAPDSLAERATQAARETAQAAVGAFKDEAGNR
ncbi:hypothetical protein G7078_05950 [Sphingomonas sinipercae]|uniref:DUF883 family protein n=1 Tax=Sphingomonas sinipercae TaxID=2714944 RepID=A0A6G7ZN07_9SPHN|nr:hypothetical protein [Sphingomonas sinipercae]QIL02377.1 hypothetical protein G7078_05950 [Sphingomonas sinipercae]